MGRDPRNVGEYFRDVPHGFSTALPEHHPRSWTKVLGILDESEETGGLVPSPEVLLVHGYNGGSLLGTATVNCTKQSMFVSRAQ